MLKINPSEMQPTKFYQLVDIIESVTPQTMAGLHAFIEMAGKAHKLVAEQCGVLAKANGDLAQQTRNSMMHRNQFDSLEKQQDDFLNFVEEVSDVNFVLIAYDTIRQINMAYVNMLDLAKNLKPRPLVLSEKRFTGKAGSFDELQHMMYEFEINAPVLNNFMMALDALDNIDGKIDATAYQIFMSLETYYKKLLHRHTIEGLKIQRDPVITDIALTVFKNIDSHGEIAKGTKVDEVSAYTVRKAEILAGALRHETVHKFIEDPGKLMEYLLMNLKALKSTAGNLKEMFRDQVDEYKLVLEEIRSWSNYDLRTLDQEMSARKFDDTLMLIGDIDPRNVSYKESDKILSSEEQFNIKFRDETLEEIVKILVVPEFQAQDLVTYVLERKSHLKKYFQEENSFYVCKIGGGNPFLGVAPGALEVIPGEKPQADLHNILGSGFDEVRKFIQGIEDAGKWHNLFLATSPSKSTDKSNVLLVGPQGCGKCVTGDTLVFTDEGLQPIGLLNKLVLTNQPYQRPFKIGVTSLNGEANSSHFHYDGVQPTIDVQTHHGYGVCGTAKHRIIVATDNGIAWKRLDVIKPGDYVGILRSGLQFGKHEMPTDKAYLLGYFVGDGNINKCKGRPSGITFTVGNEDYPHFEKYLPSIETHFGNPKIYKYGDKPYSIRVFDVILGAEMAEDCGVGADNKVVPTDVLYGTKEVWKAFLQGLFDSDGSYYGSRIEYCSNSEQLARTVHTMLTAFGIVSNLQKKNDSKAWRLFIYGRNARKFIGEIGFRLERKQRKSQALFFTKENSNYDIVPVSKEMWGNLKTDAGELSREVHKMIDPYWRGSMPSRDKLWDILDAMFCKENVPTYITDLMSTDYMWDKIISVEDADEQPVYDLVVPDGESFAANGIMNHNTQVFRAVGSDTDSISVSVQGSDFGTCWKGEMEKNPKRMFQEGLKLQKDSGRHVHFLIDEIDQVLNDDKFHGSTNLTLEFQILMDGVVNYPNLSVWGATNNPRRIPMPMIRRFSLVLVVGELSQKDRVELIQHYVKSFLPVSINQDKVWESAADKLEGATGDVIRKVADHIWRSKMSWLVHNKAEAAEDLTKMLVGESGKFDIKKFSDKDRFNFKQRLGKHFKVSAEDLNNSIDRHLNNIAIRSEIDTAVETYSDARKFLDEMNAGKI
jgi:intein/homing endonuclease